MDARDLVLDGNAAAGLLQEVFSADVTAAEGTCGGCGATDLVGALVAYTQAPGLVIRCRQCEAVLIRIVTDGRRHWVDLSGLRTLQLGG